MLIKFYYLSPYDILRPRTNQVSDIRLCESILDNGYSVQLFVPYVFRIDNLDKHNILDYYDVKNKFPIHYLETNQLKEDFSKLKYIELAWNIFKKVKSDVKKTQNKDSKIVIISRSEILLLPFIINKKLNFNKQLLIIPWLHDFKIRKINKIVYDNANIILATNSSILQSLHSQFNYPLSQTLITLNPISDNQYKNRVSKENARHVIGYHSNNPLIVYTGKLYINQKEVEYIISAAAGLPEYNFLFTGGKPSVIAYYENMVTTMKINNCKFTGFIPDYRQIKYYQFAADLLVSYYTDDVHDVRYNFPNKFCEYMLTGNPILTPEFPATKDFLTSKNAIFVKPMDSIELKNSIKQIFENYDAAKSIGNYGYKNLQNYTYNKIFAKAIKLIENSIE